VRAALSSALVLVLLGAGARVAHAQAAQAVPQTIEAPPAPPPAAPKLEPPRLLTDSPAAFPERALAEKAFDPVTVTVLVQVDTAGKVTSAHVEAPQGHGFDEAAVTAAEKLTFAPATKDGTPVAARIKWRYAFAPPAPRLVGRIARQATDSPIAGARIVARASDGTTHEAVSAADGAWAVGELPPGPVHVEVTAAGHEAQVLDERLAVGEETNIVLRLSPLAAAPTRPGPGEALEEVTVKGERPPREVTKRTLTKDEIGHIPGTNGDALRSLQNLPGVARPPPFSGLLVVRGSAPEDTNIYVDGTNIPIVYHFGGLSSVVPTEVLEKIDFYPGNYSAQYGRGMGGIVDVGLRDPKKDGKYHGMAQVDLIDTRFLVEGPIAGGWSFMAAGRRSWFDVWLKPILSRNLDTSVIPRYYDYQLMVQKDLDKKSSFRLLFFGSFDELDIVQPASATSSPTLAAGISDSTRFWRLQARYTNKFSDKTELRATAAVGQDIQEIGFGTNFSHNSTTPTSLRVEGSQKVAPSVVANTGLDMVFTPYSLDLKRPPRNRPGVPSNGPGQAIPLDSTQSGSLFLPGAYTEWELTPWKGTRIVPGLRADYDSATRGWDVAPRINARQDLTRGFPRTTLKGGVGMYYQPPQPLETDPIFGQPNLSSNRSVATDVGFEQEFTRHFSLSTDVFYKALDRLVTQDAGNSGSGFAYGAEWLLKYTPDDHFFGWVAYTLSRSERRDLPSEDLRLFRYDQTHILTMIGSYKLGYGWQVGARFRLVSGNLFTPSTYGAVDATAGSNLGVSTVPLFSQRLPLFEQLDLRADKTWVFDAWRLTLYLDVQNVYNRANAEGVSYNYNNTKSTTVTGLPILPSLGLRAEF
jgi:TonB family protein